MEPKPPFPPHSGTVRRSDMNVSLAEERKFEMESSVVGTVRREFVVRMYEVLATHGARS